MDNKSIRVNNLCKCLSMKENNITNINILLPKVCCEDKIEMSKERHKPGETNILSPVRFVVRPLNRPTIRAFIIHL